MEHGRSIHIPNLSLRRLAVCAAIAAFTVSLFIAPQALARPLVVVDAGHGGVYNHARYGSFYEKQANLLFAFELGVQLYAAGYDVNFTRTTDTAVTYGDIPTWHWIGAENRWLYAPDGVAWYTDGVPRDDLQARCNVANNLGADVFISVHCNGSASSAANGTENWASSHDALGQQLGQYVQAAVLEQTRQRNRGAGVMDFYVARWANMPALLIETGFMSNPTEGRNLANPAWRQAYVRGIVNGLNRWMATGAAARPVYTRHAGSSRSETAVVASRAQWPAGAPAVVLASTGDIASALAAPLATSRLGGPLLFADVKDLSAATVAEIARLHPTEILVLGAEIPDAILEQAAAAAGIDTAAVVRIAGSEAISAAPLLSERLVDPGAPLTVVLASGSNGIDATAASTLAASRGAALLLTRPDGSLPQEGADFLAAHAGNIGATITVGTVPDVALGGTPNHSRLTSADAYQAFALTAAATWPGGPVRAYCYNPDVPADGLTAASAAASGTGGVPVPIQGKYLSPYVREWLENSGHRLSAVTMVGDHAALPPLSDYLVAKAIR